MALGTKRKNSNDLAKFPIDFPTGCVLPYAGTTAPEGWALCDGSTLNRTTYSSLYAVVGDSNGEGDGSTTFHVPDLRGKFVRGVDSAAGNDPDAASRTAANTGGNTGDNIGSIQSDAFKSHIHGTYEGGGSGDGQGIDSDASKGPEQSDTISSTGGNETRPLNVNLNHIIKL